MKSLTDRQQAILDFVLAQTAEAGLPPSQSEVAAAFGIQLHAAQKHLQALVAKGRLRRTPGKARSLGPARLGTTRTPPRPIAPRSLPILGRVAAGAPIGADAGFSDVLALDPGLFTSTPDYLLRVRGDSMRDEGILDGDLVAIRRADTAVHGQLVVARLDGEITIKRLEIGPRGLRLLPRNREYAPISIAADADFAIEGLYCGLLRLG